MHFFGVVIGLRMQVRNTLHRLIDALLRRLNLVAVRVVIVRCSASASHQQTEEHQEERQRKPIARRSCVGGLLPYACASCYTANVLPL